MSGPGVLGVTVGSGEATATAATAARAARRPGPLLKQARAHVREWGARRALWWVLMTLAARYLGVHVHYVFVGADRPDLRDPDPPPVPPGYEARIVGLGELIPFADSIPSLTRSFLEDAFIADDECAACFHGLELVAFSFNKRSRAPVTDQLDVLVPKGFRYGYKGWTHPAHTRRNLQKLCTHVKHANTRRPFSERSIHYIETHNYPSLLRGYRRPPERSIRMGFVGWVTVFGRQVPFNTRHAKQIGFEFVRKDDPGVRYYMP
jgi:hypothetical protein